MRSKSDHLIDKMKINYSPSKEEFRAMSVCLSKGIKCYPIVLESSKNSMVTIELEFIGTDGRRKLKRSAELPFDQKYLTYHLMMLYMKLYEKIKSK